MSNGDENRTEAVFIKDTRISSLPNDVMKKWDGWKTKENKTKPWKTISNCEKHAKNIENRFGPHANRDQNWTEAVFIKETRFSSSPNDVMKRSQGTCSWSKFASNVRWPTLSFSCQKQEFRKWLITNFASASYSFTAEELNRLIVIIFEEYARQRKVEEMPLSWRYINHEARLNLEKDVFGESTWAMGSPEQCTRGLSQLRRSFFD